MPKFYNCIVCNKRTKPKERRIINTSVKTYLNEVLFMSKVSDTDTICNTCKHRYYLAESKSSTTTVNSQSSTETDPDYQPPPTSTRKTTISSPPSVSLAIPSAPTSHSRCIVCKRPGPKLIVITHDARLWALIEKNVLIRSGSRCCPKHIITDGKLKAEDIDKIPLTERSFLNRSSITKLLHEIRTICKQQTDRFINFDDIKSEECKHLTGLSRSQFDDICQHIIDKVKSTPSRSQRTSIGLFLLKIKSGISNRLISTLFKLSPSSVRRAIVTVRKALMRSFVPLYLGLEAVTREQVISQHTRSLARKLFDVDENSMILVLDGTYVYIKKSDNFCFQRQSYSTHKCRPLVKPMVVVTTTGYFVSIMGPYIARNNDAAILNHMLKRNVEDISSFLQENDLIVVDRGFRDSIDVLEDMGIRAAMPTFLKKGEKQMSVEDANTSRFVTKIRWVVESANSRIKRFKYLDKVLPSSQVPYIGDFVRIVCAVSNKYFPALTQTNSEGEDTALAIRMKELSIGVNTLKDYVEENKLDRRTSQWKLLDESDLDDFPVLSDEQLRSLTCGVYQLKLSSSYIQEYVDNESIILVHKQDDKLLSFKIQSRHVSSKSYMLWLRYSNTSITSWYCKCRAGARVVGICSHIAAVVWYLSHARHETSRKSFGVKDWGQFLADANDLPESIDSSDADSVSSSIPEE